MSNEYDRGYNPHSVIDLFYKGSRISIPPERILAQLGVSALVRIPNAVYPDELQPGQIITHANLPLILDRLNEKVALPRILQFGSFSTKGNKPPLLDFNRIWIARVIKSSTFTSYEEIDNEWFVGSSIGNFKTIEQLQRQILLRYTNPLPDLTEEQILSSGVTLRQLRLIQLTSLSLL